MVSNVDRVLLVSELFEQSSSDGPECEMTLHYHMYGAGLGVLEVSVRSGEKMEILFKVDGGGESVRLGWKWDFFNSGVMINKQCSPISMGPSLIGRFYLSVS